MTTTSSVWHSKLQWKLVTYVHTDQLSMLDGIYIRSKSTILERMKDSHLPVRIYLYALEAKGEIIRWRTLYIRDVSKAEKDKGFRDAYIDTLAECYLALAKAHEQLASGATFKSILPS